MRIKIILMQPYPHGMACTNRVHYYAKGLQENGHQIEIIVPIPLENSESAKNHKPQGVHEGVPFWYANQTTTRSKHFLKRRLGDIIGPLKASFRVLRKNNRTDVVIMVSNRLYHILLFKLMTWWSNTLIIQEKSELPFAFSRQSGQIHQIYQKVHNYLIYKSFDGMLVISTQLYSFFKPYLRKDAQLLLVPIIVNLQEFDGRSSTASSQNYIAYAGNLSDHKDGITNLIEAFHQVNQRMPDVHLYLIGKPSEEARKKVDALLDKYQLHDKVLLTGYISREKLVAYMQNARVLALAKPDSAQANFCFPSKLGEYLATGNPVVTTAVGEISQYLEDGKNALLAAPNDTTDFTEKLVQVLSDAVSASRIGQAGKKLAEEEFNYKKQGKRISDFIYDLSHRKLKTS